MDQTRSVGRGSAGGKLPARQTPSLATDVTGQGAGKFCQVRLNDITKYLKVNAKVLMDQNVAEAAYLRPRYLRMGGCYLRW